MKRRQSAAIAINSLDTVTRATRPILRPIHGWLAAVRNALGLTRASVAATLKVTPSAVQDYEKAEKADAITLATLRRVAAAMDCELIVALVPKNGLTFSQLAARRDPDFAHLRATEHSMALEAQASHDLPPSPRLSS